MRRAWLVTSRRRRIVRQPVHVRTAAPIGRESIVVRSGSDEQLYARDHGDAKADGELHAKDCKARWKSRPQLVRNKRAVVGEQFYGTVFAMLLGAFRPVDRDREVSPYEDSRAGVFIAAQRRGPESALADVPLSAATLAPGIVLSTWSGEPVTHWGRCSRAVNLGLTAQHHRAPGITKRREPGRSGRIPPASSHERTTNMCPRSGHSMRGRRRAKRSVSTTAEFHKAAAGPGTDSGPHPFAAQASWGQRTIGAHKSC
jgi:hypothetical protein